MFGLNYLLSKRNPDIEFVTSLSIDECKDRLAKELQLKTAILGLHPSHPVIERITDNRFLISRNQSFPFIDNYHPLLDGQLTTANDGTLIQASFRLNNGSLLAVLLLGFVVFFGMVGKQVISDGAEVGLLFVPIVFFGLWWLVIWLMSRYNKSKRKVLADYLQSLFAPDMNLRR